MRILFLEDDAFQRDLATGWMESAGHSVRCTGDGATAIRWIERDTFDLAVLDWEVPSPSGLEVLRWIRKRGLDTPVMFITSHDAESDVVAALDCGADDYLAKPVRRLEFLARVAALARRAGLDAAPRTLELPPYRIDMKGAAIWLGGQQVRLKPREVQVAVLLFRRRGDIVSRKEMQETVWGTRADLISRSLDTHVSRLRKLLKLDGSCGWKLETVYQRGYRLVEAVPARLRGWYARG